MICPYCGSEMENGFLSGGTILAWKHCKQKPWVSWTSKKQGGILVSDIRANRLRLQLASAASTYCRSCNIIITSPKNPKG